MASVPSARYENGMTTNPLRLGVKVDHVATVRSARGASPPDTT